MGPAEKQRVANLNQRITEFIADCSREVGRDTTSTHHRGGKAKGNEGTLVNTISMPTHSSNETSRGEGPQREGTGPLGQNKTHHGPTTCSTSPNPEDNLTPTGHPLRIVAYNLQNKGAESIQQVAARAIELGIAVLILSGPNTLTNPHTVTNICNNLGWKAQCARGCVNETTCQPPPPLCM